MTSKLIISDGLEPVLVILKNHVEFVYSCRPMDGHLGGYIQPKPIMGGHCCQHPPKLRNYD